jgi:dolichol-phosphate mannosyltransferase
LKTGIKDSSHLWAVIFTLVPLSVFVIYSIMHKPQLNWTAPVWLAAIPFVARDMVAAGAGITRWWRHFDSRFWLRTAIALILVTGGCFYYIAIGLPGAGPMSGNRLFGEWRLMAEEVGRIYTAVQQKTGSAPIVVGTDRNFISSELSFYDDTRRQTIAGSYLVGSHSLMWGFWFPRSAAMGKNLLLVDLNPHNLTSPYLPQYFKQISKIESDPLAKDGRVIGHVYWRVGYGYKGP